MNYEHNFEPSKLNTPVDDVVACRQLIALSLARSELVTALSLIKTLVKLTNSARTYQLNRGLLVTNKTVAAYVHSMVNGTRNFLLESGVSDDKIAASLSVACDQMATQFGETT